eukprot:15449240-Alexandrium_andersonii.AAC.1
MRGLGHVRACGMRACMCAGSCWRCPLGGQAKYRHKTKHKQAPACTGPGTATERERQKEISHSTQFELHATWHACMGVAHDAHCVVVICQSSHVYGVCRLCKGLVGLSGVLISGSQGLVDTVYRVRAFRTRCL